MIRKKSRNIDICLTPNMIDLFDYKNKKIVIIDVFRATSAMCVFLNNGGKRVFPVSSVEEAKELQQNIDSKFHLFAAERNGKIVSGFDFGNSPLLYHDKNFNNTSLIITTTNGTNAIEKSRKSNQGMVLASFLNMSAVVNYLNFDYNSDVLIVCSGWKGRFCIEDAILAGCLSNELLKNNQFYFSSDSVFTAQKIYMQAKGDLYKFLLDSAYSNRMKLEDDMLYCLQLDKIDTVPVWSNDPDENLISLPGFFYLNNVL